MIASAWTLLLSRLLTFYIYLQYTIVAIPVFVAIILSKRIQQHASLQQHLRRLLKVSWIFFVPTFVLTALEIIYTTHYKFQFGVDSALYIQIAHHLLRSPNHPTAVWNLVEIGHFARSAFIESHRWGLPLLIQFFTSAAFNDLIKNSYSLCAIFIALPAGLIVENLPVVEDTKNRLSKLRLYVAFPCVVLNWFLFSLLLLNV